MPNVVLSGCSGGGKSTLLEALRRRGHRVVEEPGRRIVAAELASGGTALPWIDGEAFARRALAMAAADVADAQATNGWTFFDRGLVDAASALEHFTGVPAAETLADLPRYHDQVFLTPPWPEIYATDAERRHDFSAAVAEYDRLLALYPALGYTVDLLPRVGIEARADYLLAGLTHA